MNASAAPAALLLLALCGCTESNHPAAPADPRRMAQTACREFVKQSLHDPGGAQFDDTSAFTANEYPVGIWNVIVTGRARNGFNALRQMRALCIVEHAAGQWSLQSVKQLDN